MVRCLIEEGARVCRRRERERPLTFHLAPLLWINSDPSSLCPSNTCFVEGQHQPEAECVRLGNRAAALEAAQQRERSSRQSVASTHVAKWLLP